MTITLPPVRGTLTENKELSGLTWMRVGGPADWLFLPADPTLVFARPWTPFTYGFANYYLGFLGLISFAFGFWWLSWMRKAVTTSSAPSQRTRIFMWGSAT